MATATREVVLDELGDPNAPVGSHLWSLWVANEIRKALYDKQRVGTHLRNYVSVFKEKEGWREFGSKSWDAYCRKYLGRPATEVDTEADVRALAAHGGDRKSDEYQGNNYNLDITDRGTDSTYLTARIARDRPDILDGMKAGKYRSVRAAAIDAGIIDPEKSKRFQLPTDPEAAARYLIARVDSDWLASFLIALGAA